MDAVNKCSKDALMNNVVLVQEQIQGGNIKCCICSTDVLPIN